MIRKIFSLVILALILVACGTPKGKFHLEGRFRNLNQGEFYVYSPDGYLDGFDTIQVSGGQFEYESDVTVPQTLILVFPNFSEQAVFAESGASVTIEGDASHMKEMTIKGTQVNKEYTQFRMDANRATPPEIIPLVQKFVTDHPQSPASVYLITHYLVQVQQPKYKLAYQLASLMMSSGCKIPRLELLKQQLASLQHTDKGASLPAFQATDIQGRKVGNALLNGRVNVIYTSGTWSFDSHLFQQQLHRLKQQYGSSLTALGFAIDGSADKVREQAQRDSVSWSLVCDGKLWQGAAVTQMGLATVPGNIVVDRGGKVIARNATIDQIQQFLKSSK